VAMLVPLAGGIVEVVLSVAAIAGGALFAPIIWSLYSKRQNAFSVITTTIVALLINLFFKVIAPSLVGLKFNRTIETLLGVGLPLLMLAGFEWYYASKGMVSERALAQEREQSSVPKLSEAHHAEARRQNVFGLTVIVIASAVVGLGIFSLGLAASQNDIVMAVGGGIFVLSSVAFLGIRRPS